MTPVPAGRCGELRGRKDARSAVLRDAHDASPMALSRTAARLMNRLLLDRRVDAVEIITASSAHGTGGVRSGVGVPVVRAVLTAGDARTVHVREVLGLASGDCLRCGVVGGGVDDYATVAWLDDATGEGRSGEASSGTGDEASSGTGGCTGGRRLAITATAACLNFPGPWPQATGGIVTSNNDNNNNGTASSLPWRRPRVDVVLAMPAPRLMARLIPLISSLGVDRLMLVLSVCHGRHAVMAWHGYLPLL